MALVSQGNEEGGVKEILMLPKDYLPPRRNGSEIKMDHALTFVYEGEETGLLWRDSY